MKFNYKKNAAVVMSLLLTGYAGDLAAFIPESKSINAEEAVTGTETDSIKKLNTDVNSDGVTDEEDVRAVLGCMAGSVGGIKADENNNKLNVYDDDVIDIKDAVLIQKTVKGEKTEGLVSEDSDNTADVYIENVTCSGGDKVVVSVGIVDWRQDIESLEMNLNFDSMLKLDKVDTLGNISYAAGDNKVKLFGFFDKKSAYRGRAATLTFTVPEVDKLTRYNISADSASIYSSSLKKYTANCTYGTITADSSLKPCNLHTDAVNSSSVSLGWDMTHNIDRVSGYIIYRNGEEISRTSENKYTDTELVSGTEYIYTVQAYGDDGYLSDISKGLSVVPDTARIESIDFKKMLGSIGSDSADVKFALNRDTHIKEYSIYSINEKDEKTLIFSGEEAVMSGGDFKWNLEGMTSGDYKLQIIMKDADGAEISKTSDSVSVDRDAPDPVYGFSAYENDECVSLTWGISSQLNTVKYNIFRRTQDSEYECIATVDGRDTLDYADKNTENGTVYYYNITAVDCFGQESNMTDEVCSSSREDSSPPEVTLFMPESGSVISGKTVLYAKASDNIGVASLKFFVSEDKGETWSEINSSEGQEARWEFDTSEYTEQDVEIKVIAYDQAGNESSGTNIHSYHIDNKAPEKVADAELVEVFDTYATIKWSDVTDNDRDHYIVECTDMDTNETSTQLVYSTLGINLKNLKVGTQYSVTVSAADKQGNTGEKSDPVIFKTSSDVHNPEILSISPAPGYYKDSIPLCAVVRDNSSISSAAFEISADGKEYTRLTQIMNDSLSSTFTARYDLDLTGYEDSKIYIRVIAEDAEGNKSSEDSLINEYIIDTQKPQKMQGVTVNAKSNSIEVRWNSIDDDVISYFRLFRSTQEDGEYELIADKLSTINYFDRNIEPGTTYFYKVSAVDAAGNESDLSDACSAMIEADTTAPVIESIAPDTSMKLTKLNNKIGVLASDNICLSEITVEYCSEKGNKDYTVLASNKYDKYYGQLQAVIPESELIDQNVIHIRTYAVDKYGNKSDYKYADYTVDNSSTKFISLTAEGTNDDITLNWSAQENESTLGYYIYRKFNSEDYTLIGSVQADSTAGGKYKYTDENITQSGICKYKISAISSIANDSFIESNEVEMCQKPEISIGCEDKMEKDVEYVFDASGAKDFYGISKITIDYGDGTVKTVNKASDAKFVHKYAANGTYKITVTCTNIKDMTSVVSKTVEITDRAMIGEVTVSVKTTDGKAASNIVVYCDVGTEFQTKKRTDSNGNVTFKTTSGNHAIGVYSDGYLPDIKNCTIVAGTNNPIEFSVVEQDIVTAEFDVQRMTLDEIKAVGINVNDPRNQHIVKVNVHLQYALSQEASEGTIYVGGGGGCGTASYVAWSNINPPSGKGGGRKIEPVAVITNDDDEIDTLILLDIPVEASYLKEFFDVKLYVINNASSEYSLNNNIITLNVPDGLTLMDALKCNGKTTCIDEIKGQTQQMLEWVIRGDDEGTYKLSADYTGTLSQFNETINREFESDDIKVYGESAVKIDMYVPGNVDYNDMYIKLSVTNQTDVDVYNVSAVIGNVMSSTFGVKAGVAAAPYIYALRAPDGHDVYIAPEAVGDKLGIETLSGGYTYSVIYHLAGIFTDTINPSTGEMVNFNEEVLNLINAYIERENDSKTQFSLHVVNESDILSIYNHSNDEDNLKRLSNETKGDLDLLENGDNLSVTTVAEQLRNNWAYIRQNEMNDDCLDFLLNFSFDDLKDTDKNNYIDSIIMKLLVSDELTKKVQDQYKDEMVQNISTCINSVLSFIKTNNDLKGYAENIIKFVNSDQFDTLTALNRYNSGGSQSLAEYLTQELHLNPVTQADVISSFNSTVEDAMKFKLSTILTGLGVLADTAQSAQDQWNYYLQIQMLKCVKEEANMLLTTLSVPVDNDEISYMIYMRAESIRSEINSCNIVNIVNGGSKVVQTAAESITSSILGDTMSGVIEGAAGPLGLVIYDLAKISYGMVQQDIDNKYLLPAKVMILDSMSKAVIRDMDRMIANSDVRAMKYVEYLAKLRIDECTACKTFIYSCQNEKFDAEYITTPGLRLLYEAILNNTSADELTDDITRIQFSVDRIFMPGISSSSNNVISSLTYNYAANHTDQSFDNTYEYRINDGAWTDCSGTVSAGTDFAGKLLQVRKKAVDGGIAGTTAYVRLLRGDYFEGDLKVRYKNGYYIFDEIGDGRNIQVIFSNSSTVSEAEWKQALTYKGTSIQNPSRYKYVHVRKAATSKTPASLTKTAAVLDSANVLVGSNDGGTVTGAGKYDIGESVTLTAAPNESHTFAGWMIDGKIVSKDKTYKLTANSDVTVYAKFLAQADYRITLSSNAAKTVQTGCCIDSDSSVYVISSACEDSSLVFSHWEDENGNIVSLVNTCPFIIEHEMQLKAVYVTKE